MGASGSGKSSLGRALLRLFRRGVHGRIEFEGEDLLLAGREPLRRLRGRLGVIFQDPYASLDPRMRVMDLALLFITHDMSAAHALADRVAVMDQGRLVEVGDAGQVLSRPAHPITRSMMAGRALWTA